MSYTSVAKWYVPLDWNKYQPNGYPAVDFVALGGSFAFLELLAKNEERYLFDVYDYAQSFDPMKKISATSLDGLRVMSENERAEILGHVAKKMLDAEVRRE
jgi:hypothetical protein